MHGRVSCLGVSMIAALLLLACGGSKEESSGAAYPMNPPTGNAATGQPGQPNPGYTPTGTQTQPGTQPQPAPTTPQPVPTTPQPAPSAVQELDVSMAVPVEPLLQQLAKTQIPPGAKAFGNKIVANFPAGGKLEKQIQLTANKCYTVVAAGAPGVSEVNLKFYNLPLLTLAVDNTTGAQATLGATPNCYKQILISAPMTLAIEVPAGQGLVAVQIYEK